MTNYKVGIGRHKDRDVIYVVVHGYQPSYLYKVYAEMGTPELDHGSRTGLSPIEIAEWYCCKVDLEEVSQPKYMLARYSNGHEIYSRESGQWVLVEAIFADYPDWDTRHLDPIDDEYPSEDVAL